MDLVEEIVSGTNFIKRYILRQRVSDTYHVTKYKETGTFQLETKYN